MSRTVTLDMHDLGETELALAGEAVAGTGVTIRRASAMTFPVRKAQLSVEGADAELDAAYEAVVAAFPGTVVEVREKEFPWHWEGSGR